MSLLKKIECWIFPCTEKLNQLFDDNAAAYSRLHRRIDDQACAVHIFKPANRSEKSNETN